MDTPKYSLKDLTKEERDAFLKDFQSILEKHSVYFEPIPKMARKDLHSPWQIVCDISILKKVENKQEKKDESPSDTDSNTTDTK